MTRNIMKGNFKLKVSILLLFFSFCCIKSTWAQGDNCGNNIRIISTTSAGQGNNGSVKAQIDGSGLFEVKLFEISAKGKSLIKVVKSFNAGLIIFDNLKVGSYKILVEYTEYTDPMCQFLQLGGISIKRQ
jgi:hypothetical protein